MAIRKVLVHGLLFGVASVAAYQAWSEQDTPHTKHVGAELWSGRADSVSRVEFSTSKRKLLLEPQSDARGAFFVATVTPLVANSSAHKGSDANPHSADPHGANPHGAGAHAPPANPHGAGAHAPPANPDGAGGAGPLGVEAPAAAGASGMGANAGPAAETEDPAAASEPPAPPKRFISVERGQQLMDALAALRAHRVLGKVEGDRLAEFGFDGDNGTLEVVVGRQVHRLQFGDKTPGGKDRYVRDAQTGQGYVIAGAVANDLTGSDNRLIERDFHDFGDEEAVRVTLRSAGAGREVRRHPTEKAFWASVDEPETKDETLSNWMTKLQRLSVTQYVEQPDPEPTEAEQVVRVEYANAKGKPLGYLEIVRQPPSESGGRTQYLARSERSRWYATILRSTAEQLDQDLASIFEK